MLRLGLQMLRLGREDRELSYTRACLQSRERSMLQLRYLLGPSSDSKVCNTSLLEVARPNVSQNVHHQQPSLSRPDSLYMEKVSKMHGERHIHTAVVSLQCNSSDVEVCHIISLCLLNGSNPLTAKMPL